MSALRSLGLRALDVVVVSHGDNDHAGGLLGAEANIRIRKLISNRKNLRSKLPAQLHSNSYDWKWNGVEFRFLQKGARLFLEEQSLLCVADSLEGGSVLMFGDIEREADAQLARSYVRQLWSDVLLALHHGSRSSSS